jgi:predicted DNA-binding WGR domain protein
MLYLLDDESWNAHCIGWKGKTEMVILTRVNAEKHMDRWYAVGVQSTLFDTYSVVCFWGSRRSNYQRARVIPVEDKNQALNMVEKIIRRKVRRGYQLSV